jgi:hypothetical protein
MSRLSFIGIKMSAMPRHGRLGVSNLILVLRTMPMSVLPRPLMHLLVCFYFLTDVLTAGHFELAPMACQYG